MAETFSIAAELAFRESAGLSDAPSCEMIAGVRERQCRTARW
jgi:hypothetical protein